MTEFESNALRLQQSELAQAQALLDLRRYKDALPIITSALAHDPENFYICLMLAQTYFYLEDWDRAQKQTARVLHLLPTSDQAHALMARVLLEKKIFYPALEHARNAVKLDPEDAYNHYVLSICEKQNGHYKLAYDAIMRALELSPEESYYHILIAELALQLKKYQQAEIHVREALSHDPENATAHYSLALVLYEQSLYKQALPAAYQAVKLMPNNQGFVDFFYNLIEYDLNPNNNQENASFLAKLGPEVLSFYEYQKKRRGWFKRFKFSALLSIWLLAFIALLILMNYLTDEFAR